MKERLARATLRASHMNSLISNVGLHLEARVNLTGKLVWIIHIYDMDDGSYMGTYDVYAHERSAVRAAWRLYRKATE